MLREGVGLFITIEGGEGSGKSTLIDGLYRYFTEEKGLFVVKTFEPGGTPFGQLIRKILLEKHDLQIVSKAELLLFLADRAHHVQTLIEPALRENMIVLCDRFTDSSLAYQGGAREIAQIDPHMEQVCQFATGGLVPDKTFYLDLDPKIGLSRIRNGYDRLEQETLFFHQRVQESYRLLAKKHPKRIITIDGRHPPEEVLRQAIEQI